MSSTRFPDARVAFGADYAQRVTRLAGEFASRRSRGLEAHGAGRRAGGGDEFVGHRPLRVGEDARDLDWELYARLERAFVRERRAEAGERWAIVLDSSRSMGVGEPSKIQSAAELAGALIACGVRCGARVEVLRRSSTSSGVETLACAKAVDLARALRWLEETVASNESPLSELCAHPRLAAARRVFVLGDLFDAQPAQVLALARRGRFVSTVAILARVELSPPSAGEVRWVDPESGASVALALDERVAERYASALERRLDSWARSLARHGQSFTLFPSERAFESVVRELL